MELNDNFSGEPAFVRKHRRNRKVLLSILGCIAVLMVILLIAIQFPTSGSSKNTLVGKWKLNDYSSITFRKDGTASWKSDVGTQNFEWSTDGSTMTWYFNGRPYYYSWVIENDNLYVDGEYYGTRQP